MAQDLVRPGQDIPAEIPTFNLQDTVKLIPSSDSGWVADFTMETRSARTYPSLIDEALECHPPHSRAPIGHCEGQSHGAAGEPISH